MKNSPLTRLGRPLLLSAAAAAGAWALILLAGPSGRLAASEPPGLDFDRDGLSDAQEAALGTSAFLIDTDGDGYTDGEELAHQTSPWVAASVPSSAGGPLHVGLFARGENQKTRVILAVSTTDGDLEAVNLGFEILRPGALHTLDARRLLLSATVLEEQFGQNRHLTVFEVGLPQALVQGFATLSFGASIAPGGNSAIVSRATLDIACSPENVVLQRRFANLIPPTSLTSGQAGQSPDPGSSVHDPIPAGGTGDLPESWLAGKVCYQRLETVGISPSGLTLIKEVVEAYCDGNWNSWCDADCPGTVGMTIEVLDPAGLIGG